MNTIATKTAMADSSKSGSRNANLGISNSDYVRESNENIQLHVMWKSAHLGEGPGWLSRPKLVS